LILVTGATGFLGRHVVAALAGRPVRALVRQPTSSLPVEQVVGDVLDPASLAEAARGAEVVVHLAGLVSRDPDDAGALMRLHVDGTRNVLAAAHDAERVIVASSSGTTAVSREPEPIPTEERPHAIELVRGWPYYLSKIYQEQVAMEDPRAVLLLPSLLLGPGDDRGSSTDDVLRFLRRKLPYLPTGGVSFVDVRDAAAATVAAIDRGRSGERYFLGGPNWTFDTFFGRLERLAKVAAPRLRVPAAWARAGAGLLEQLGRGGTDRIAVEMSEHFWYLDAGKAARELDFQARDPQATLLDTIRYLRAHFLGTV
jgi:dihydroflavonol-4-reductase